MMMKKQSVLILCAFVAGGLLLSAAAFDFRPFFGTSRANGAESPLRDGMLVRAEGSARIYYLENGLRRYVPSPEVMRIQGLRWEDVVDVPPAWFEAHSEGERLGEDSQIILPAERGHIPDLAPFPMENPYLSREGGRVVLRFSSIFVNLGADRLDLYASPKLDAEGDEELETIQRIVREDGFVRHKVVGNFLWHAPHAHYHYDDFAQYVLRPVHADPANTESTTRKTTFCLRDDRLIDPGLPGAPSSKYFSTCGKTRQGVSVGWADVYAHTLPDQYIDVTGLPAGIYRLEFDVDPLGRFVEERTDNNVSIVILELDPAGFGMRVIASGTPFSTGANRYPDGMLVRGDKHPGVFVVERGLKRPILSEEAFLAAGYAWKDVYFLPQSVVDAIDPSLIKSASAPAVYVVNDAGYRRQLLSPEVLASYGWSDADVAVVSDDVLSRYPETDLVQLEGDGVVLSLSVRKAVDNVSDPASVHVINRTDLEAYSVQTVATGLEVPWDVAFLPDGDMLVTERPGTLRRLGKNPAIIEIPSVRATGEGGLMALELHPNFASNRLLYLYFTSTEGGTENRLVRYRLDGDRLVEDRVILSGIPAAIYHDGGGMAFGPDGMLYLTTGDANSPASSQNVSSLAGKTLRITPDGGIPSDNPFGTAVWSYGHRNAQGIAWDGAGRQWQTEHGRSGALSGFDELNLIEKGQNYGWPNIQGDQQVAGMRSPVLHSGASLTWAPSGLAHVGGSLYFAGLLGEALYQAELGPGAGVIRFNAHFHRKFGRLRSVDLGPDGFLYVTTSNRDGRGSVREGDDKVLKIAPDFLR